MIGNGSTTPVPARFDPLVLASGGGFSRCSPGSAYQDGVPVTDAMRGVPDVTAYAPGTTGMALAFSVPGGGYGTHRAPVRSGILTGCGPHGQRRVEM